MSPKSGVRGVAIWEEAKISSGEGGAGLRVQRSGLGGGAMGEMHDIDMAW